MANENCVQKEMLIKIESIKLSDLNSDIEIDQQEIMYNDVEEDGNDNGTNKLKESFSTAVKNDYCDVNTNNEPKNSEIDESNKCHQMADENHQINRNEGKFYEEAKKYWSNIPATVDGMLGGFGNISEIDLKGSRTFLNCLYKMKPSPGKRYALDCGAGIGRITKGLLLKIFDRVDIVEQDSNFTHKLRDYIDSKESIGLIHNVGLQEFVPELTKYDVVWCQWVLGHLTDDDLMKFFQRIKLSLFKNGLLIIKENVSSSNNLEVDDVDSSMTRSLQMYKNIIKKSNYQIIKLTKQTNFPKGLYPVYIFACKPIAK